MQKYLLSVDNGGTYIKAVLFDIHGSQIAVVKHRNCIINKGYGWVELDQEELWNINCKCIKEIMIKADIKPEEILCIGFAGQGKGLYMVDSAGKSFRNAITSSDSRADSYCRMWEADGTADRYFTKLYQTPVAGQTVPLLRWLKDNEPDNYNRIRWVFSMKDYLFYRLTGKAIGGKGSQSGTCLVNLDKKDYDLELLQAFGIPEVQNKLPPLVWDTELCGEVTEEASIQCGCAIGTPVSAGMFDVDASAIAMGVIDPKQMFIIAGTCGINGYISRELVANHSVMFNSLYSLPDTYLIEEGSSTSAGVLEWVIGVIFEEEKKEILYSKINQMVEDTVPEKSKLMFMPFLNGFRHGGTEGSANSRGSWVGLCPEHTRADMVRAVYEGVVFTHMIHLEHLLKNRKLPEKILMAGGATQSKVWVQIFADSLGIPVEIINNEEMGAKGVAVASAVAVGLYSDIKNASKNMIHKGTLIYPRKEYYKIYSEKYERYKKTVYIMEEIWKLF